MTHKRYSIERLIDHKKLVDLEEVLKNEEESVYHILKEYVIREGGILVRCKECKKIFVKPHARYPDRCLSCTHIHDIRIGKKQRKIYTIECRYCKKEFQSVRSVALFCSKECYLKDHMSGPDKKSICPKCSRVFTIKHRNQKFCSVVCAVRFRKCKQ